MNNKELTLKIWTQFFKFAYDRDIEISSNLSASSFVCFNIRKFSSDKKFNRGSISLSINKSYFRVGLMYKKENNLDDKEIEKITNEFTKLFPNEEIISNTNSPTCKMPTIYVEKKFLFNLDKLDDELPDIFEWIANIKESLEKFLSTRT